MQPLRNATKRQSGYVCLSCRLQSSDQKRISSLPNIVGLQSAQDERSGEDSIPVPRYRRVLPEINTDLYPECDITLDGVIKKYFAEGEKWKSAREKKEERRKNRKQQPRHEDPSLSRERIRTIPSTSTRPLACKWHWASRRELLSKEAKRALRRSDTASVEVRKQWSLSVIAERKAELEEQLEREEMDEVLLRHKALSEETEGKVGEERQRSAEGLDDLLAEHSALAESGRSEGVHAKNFDEESSFRRLERVSTGTRFAGWESTEQEGAKADENPGQRVNYHHTPSPLGDEAVETSLVDVMLRNPSLASNDTKPSECIPEKLVKQRNPVNRPFVSNSSTTHRKAGPRFSTPPVSSIHSQQARLFHTSHKPYQQATATVSSPEADLTLLNPPLPDQTSKLESPIRIQLRQWQELHGKREDLTDYFDHDIDPNNNETANNLTRLPNDESSFRQSDIEEEEERRSLAHFGSSSTRDLDSATVDTRWLQAGDLVELEFPRSEKESVIAVFVRGFGFQSQFFAMNGRWVHRPERYVQYRIPGWISPDLITPLLPYLPEPQNVQEAEEVEGQAFVQDLTVPREVSAGLVSRMVQFHTESQEIYRRHASTLDNAHTILAHETDLRYGSLLSAAMTLLKLRAEDLPVTALFTVRKALSRAGFAFNIDRRSHRLTGYLQIRSKEQVRMVEEVRGWLRDWQDDMAVTSAIEERDGEEHKRKLKRHRQHRTTKGAQYVYNFVEKAKKIVMKSRENRDPTPYGNIGPSKKKFEITEDADCVKITTDTQFTREDRELVKFMEAWACSNMFLGLPRIEALPPLVLHAVGLYRDIDVTMATGYLFLQELGTIMPYENRVKFDPHLLLPSSQHSKPLQTLMASLLTMKDKHEFSDAMKDVRHDWGSLAVYCIDDTGAHEIDDGLSVEKVAGEVNQWWVRIHIANPTAFFERDHPLAKMARHMGESIYMPERTYMMLPRWATQGYFSLATGRPCLTFSVRMDDEGRTLERKVQSGVVRNVLSLSGEEVNQALGAVKKGEEDLVLTVGGEPPPSSQATEKKNMLGLLSVQRVEELRTLRRLAGKRVEIRRKAGGVFFNVDDPQVDVWQRWQSTGLAWDHPWRYGSRTVEGDPVIRMRTRGLTNWFAPSEAAADVLVREMMLLASETAATWCAERQIPAIFRSVVRRPDLPDPDALLRDVVLPAAKETPDGAYPLHLGIQYVQCLGNTVLHSNPLKHTVMGLDYYSKVTSPLRRYGDMILHWQIEAALREEARRGKSLITEDTRVDRSFLPFSANVLSTIMLGLQPRETMVRRAKRYSSTFWILIMLFRAHHFNEIELPFYTEAHPTLADGRTKPLMRIFIHTALFTDPYTVHGLHVELGISTSMLKPERFGLEEVRRGDVWECELDHVNVFRRAFVAKPVRLVERAKVGDTFIR